MTKILAIDIEKCTGCRNCELACSISHTGTFNPRRARIQVIKEEKRDLVVPVVCLQCETPLCEQACPNGAIQRNEYGALYVNDDTCIGCQNCVTACIYGGIEIDPRSRKAIKCDLCGGDPACVKACDYGAITFVESGPKGRLERSKGVEVLSPFFEVNLAEAEE
ncbi:MAG: 4Fe-4S dicluster domain-containing protein [Candidatus Thorarchaeota archaeon]|nr:4Fe-4S dicluster domain-containing protein [Candidatus Thorarchaeota archaeon]